ncbi:hypothetical protein [Rhizobium etli]|uniref:hypothetical protein n=1 Tax=Rhizobium etli TaxID=29449 RepID=UPI00038399F1|nr:hypothetical protein [Rhizobium etli]AGS25822.1 hypothetical protein REMIM1_PF00152 [Rhizobium etli bv. mimosae str. Mim1]
MSAIDFTDPETIASLTEALRVSGVDGLEISSPGGHLRIIISNPGKTHVSTAGAVRAAHAVAVKAPIAGLFCASHPSETGETEAPPPVVSEKDVIGFIRIGHVLLPIQAGRSGLLARQVAKPGALVGFGDALFEIEPQS